MLRTQLLNNSVDALPNLLSPQLPEFGLLLARLHELRAVTLDSSFSEVMINSSRVDAGNSALIKKLTQLGKLTKAAHPDRLQLQTALEDAQRDQGLLADGVLRSSSIEGLNLTIKDRIAQLNQSINYYRWLSCLLRTRSIILVNIPAANMQVYREGKPVLRMRMVLGKPTTPTPTLMSMISDVVLYPYWHVPKNIATKELLPLFKRDRAAIERGNYQLMDRSGKVVNPARIHWPSLSGANFPYTIRQGTGCDNSLGLLKLNFYSPFGVYLHDTPFKSAFQLNRRFFSHGCLRMEDPIEIGRLVLKPDTVAIDTLTERGCLLHQAPVIIPVKSQFVVLVWYHLTGIEADGRVVFYPDVYGRFGSRDRHGHEQDLPVD